MAWVNFTSFDVVCGATPTDFLVGYVGVEEKRTQVKGLKNGLSAGEFPVESLKVTENANVSGNLAVGTNLTVLGNLSVLGDYSVIDTITTVTSALSVVNIGTGPALTIKQTGAQPIAQFFDDSSLAVLIDDGGNTGFGEKPNERVTVSGNISANGNLYLTETSFVSGQNFIGGNQHVEGITSHTGNVWLTGNQYIRNRLYVNDFARIGTNLRVATFACITGDSMTLADSYTNGNNFIGGTNNITGIETLSSDLLVAGAGNINSNLKVGGTFWTTGNATLSSDEYVGGNHYTNGNSYVGGVTNATGNLSLSSNAFIAGNEFVNGNLNVGGTARINGELQTLSNASLSSDVYISGNTNVLQKTTTNKLSVVDGLSATGFNLYNGPVLFNEPVSYNNTLTINYDLSVGRTLFVNGSAALGNSPDDKIFVAGAVYGNNKLSLGNVGPGGFYSDPLSSLVLSNDFNNTGARYNKLVLLNDAETLINRDPTHIVEFVQNVDGDRGPIAKVLTRAHETAYVGDHNDVELHVGYNLTGANNLSAVVIVNQGGNIHLGQKTTNTVNISGNVRAGSGYLSSNHTFTGKISGHNESVSFNQGRATGSSSFAANSGLATGYRSFACNTYTFADGDSSHAEGAATIASGIASHAEGLTTNSTGHYSHAEGHTTEAAGTASHSEGYSTHATGGNSHAEGAFTIASGQQSHAEGDQSEANGNFSHAEGFLAKANGGSSHAQGSFTKATGDSSHAGGYQTVAEGQASTALGKYTHAQDNYTLASGLNASANGEASHAFGRDSLAIGDASFTMGRDAIAYQARGVAVGRYVWSDGSNAFALGRNATAKHDRTFVWGGAGGTNNTFANAISSTKTDQFLISALNGVFIPGKVGINTDSTANDLTINGTLSSHTIYVDDLTINNDLRVYNNGQIDNNLIVGNNTTVYGNLSVAGTMTYLDTAVSVTSALSVVNIGTGPALNVVQAGAQPIAQYFDDSTLAVIIADGGKVGINTGTPEQKLHVVGNAKINNATAGLEINQGTGDSSILDLYSSTAINGGVRFEYGVLGNPDVQLWNYEAGYVKVGTNNAERLRITSDGKVGINTASPEQKLHVDGNVKVTGGLSASNIFIDKDDVNLIGEVQTLVNPATATGDFLILNINGTSRAVQLWSFTS